MKILQTEDAAAGRPRRGRRVATSLAEINVVPLVDVMLVLLIIFMITAPMIQRGVDVKLPVARQAERISGERLFVTVPLTYRRNHLVYLGDEALRLEILQERVRQKMATQTEKQVYLRGDGGVQLQELMEVFSGLQAAGVSNIGILLRAPGEQ